MTSNLGGEQKLEKVLDELSSGDEKLDKGLRE